MSKKMIFNKIEVSTMGQFRYSKMSEKQISDLEIHFENLLKNVTGTPKESEREISSYLDVLEEINIHRNSINTKNGEKTSKLFSSCTNFLVLFV